MTAVVVRYSETAHSMFKIRSRSLVVLGFGIIRQPHLKRSKLGLEELEDTCEMRVSFSLLGDS